MDFEKGSMENIAITNTKYSVDLLNKYPHVIFVFGDNMIRKGKGGQAIISDCQNSFGISTKRYPKIPKMLSTATEKMKSILHYVTWSSLKD